VPSRFIGVTSSPALVATVDDVVHTHDLQRTILLQGSDPPGNTVPKHCSFGGEGTPYARHLLPTIGVIAAPQFLYDPAFGLEGIDFDVMHDELLGFTALVQRLGTMEQSAIAGDIPADRMLRAGARRGVRPYWLMGSVLVLSPRGCGEEDHRRDFARAAPQGAEIHR